MCLVLCCIFPVNLTINLLNHVNYVGRRNKFFTTNTISFHPINQKIIAFRSTDINIVFSDILHENKGSIIGEGIRSIKPT